MIFNMKQGFLMMLILMMVSLTSLVAGTISGTITNPEQQPVDHAMVQLILPNPMNNHEMVVRQTMTSATGTYLFNNVQFGQYSVAAMAPEYLRTFYTSPDGQILIVEVDADDQEIVGIDIQLTPQNDPPPPPQHTGVMGRVTNANGQPVPNAQIGVVLPDTPNLVLDGYNGHTNMMGVYSIMNMQPGTYKTCVLGPNAIPVAWSAVFTVVAEAITDSVDILLDGDPPVDQYGAVSGHVIGADMGAGMMINVGLVTLDNPTQILPGLFGHAGHMGYYQIMPVPVGSYKACVIGPDNAPVAYSEPFTIVAGQMTQNVDIVMGTFVGFSVSGTIYSAAMQPVLQGVVELRSVGDDNDPMHHHQHRTVHIGTNGNYLFTNVPAGQYIVSVWTAMSPVVYYPSVYNPEDATPINVVDADITGINITIPVAQDYTISGIVKDAITDQPLAGIRVRTDRMGFHHFPMHDPMFYNEYSALTDASGAYTITAPVGRYTLVANDSTHTYRHQFYDHVFRPFDATVILLDENITGIDFDLVPFADSLNNSISGVVTENGEAITYPVRVVAVSSDEDWEESTITDASGSYTLHHLVPGEYYVAAYSLYSPPLYYNEQLTWEDADLVTVNGQVSGINFNFTNTDTDGPGNVNGLITNSNGNALDNVIIVLTNSNGQIIGFSRTNELGQYSISNVPNEAYTIIATKIGYNSVTQLVNLDGTQIIDFVMQSPTANDDNVVPNVPAAVTNYPNPFNPNTNILFTAPKDARVSVKIFNIKGQCIRNLLNSNVKAGSHVLNWDGKDDNGTHVSSGIYMVRMQSEGFNANHKMTLMK